MSYIHRTNPPVNYDPSKVTIESLTKALEKANQEFWKNKKKQTVYVGADWMMALSDEHFLLFCGDKTIVVLTGLNGLKQIEERYNKLISK